MTPMDLIIKVQMAEDEQGNPKIIHAKVGKNPFSTMDDAHPCADAVNGLVRNHWFNGKLLTGDSLRREQTYNDIRDRLVAQIHRAGIAWGLGLELPKHVPPLPPRMADSNGTHEDENQATDKVTSAATCLCPDDTLVLREGLAFDDTGRPILVGQRHAFTLEQLIDRHVARPTIATKPPIRFAPCVCLHEMPYPAGFTGFQPGVYLLVIEPGHCATGPAKVHHALCSDSVDPCVPDGVAMGFRLRLVYLPAPWAKFHAAESAWALRSNLSHWFHEVFEHPLHERWGEAPMPDACDAAAQHNPMATAIPIAAMFLDQDRKARFIDPWIPRRHLTDTRSSESLRHALGAPTASASEARIRQFQCQLGEALAAPDATKRNLYELGFRAIPPAGFLPLDLPQSDKPKLGNLTTWGEITAAREAVKVWFEGTNLIPIVHSAPMDDDVFVEFQRAVNQDLVPVRPMPEPLNIEIVGRLTAKNTLFSGGMTATATPTILVGAALLSALFKGFAGVTMEQLVNREVAFVRVIVPIEGLRRNYPGIGRVKGMRTAATAQLLRAAIGLPQTGDGGHDDPLLGDLLGLSAAPYPWAVYHRQRIVLLDVLYIVLDLLGDLMVFLTKRQVMVHGVKVEGVKTGVLRSMVGAESGGANMIATATGLTEADEVREVLAAGLRSYAPDAAAAGLWKRYRKEEKRALDAGADPLDAADAATDALTEVSAAGNVLRLFGVVAPRTRDALVDDLERLSEVEGGVRERDTLAMRAYHPDDHIRHFETPEEYEVFKAVDAELRRTPLTEMHGLDERAGTAGDLLDRTEVDIRRDQPTGTTYVSDTLVGHARKLRTASAGLASAGWATDADLRERVRAAFTAAESVEEAVKTVKDTEAAGSVAVLGDVLGMDATRRFLARNW